MKIAWRKTSLVVGLIILIGFVNTDYWYLTFVLNILRVLAGLSLIEIDIKKLWREY